MMADDATLLIKGLVLGFSIAAPVGPMGLLCIRRSLAGGFWLGFITGLGTACADAIYGVMATGGLHAASVILLDNQLAIRLIGGAFLCYLGITTLLAKPAEQTITEQRQGAAGAFASAFILTLTNPLTILSFAAIFAGLGVGLAGNFHSASFIVLGVFGGSSLWWLFLSTLTSYLRSAVTGRWLLLINRVSGLVIAGFGVACFFAA
jgi:threonine/homoserine/homoserine lactone efflux protein